MNADLASDLLHLGFGSVWAALPALVPAEWFFFMRAGTSLSTLPTQWRWPPGVLHAVKCAFVLGWAFLATGPDPMDHDCTPGLECPPDSPPSRGQLLVAAVICATPLWVHLALVWRRRSNDNGLAVAMGPAAFLSMGGDHAALGPALLTFCAYLVPAESPLRARAQIGLVTAAAVAFLGLRARFDDLGLATAATVVLVWLPLVAVLRRR